MALPQHRGKSKEGHVDGVQGDAHFPGQVQEGKEKDYVNAGAGNLLVVHYLVDLAGQRPLDGLVE